MTKSTAKHRRPDGSSRAYGDISESGYIIGLAVGVRESVRNERKVLTFAVQMFGPDGRPLLTRVPVEMEGEEFYGVPPGENWAVAIPGRWKKGETLHPQTIHVAQTGAGFSTRPTGSQRGSRPLWVVGGALALLAIGAAIFIMWRPSFEAVDQPARSTPMPEGVLVPDVVGLELGHAVDVVKDAGLRYSVEDEVSDQETFTVIRTDPAAGTQVPPDTRITIYFSFGQ